MPCWDLARRAIGRARILCSGEVPHVRLTHIFNRNVSRKRVDWVPSSVRWTESADEILASDVDIVIELVGGLRPAYDWVRARCSAGKSVVTANKQLMAHHGTELLDLARSRGLEVRFEASVAGGIPVLRALQEGLAGDRLVEVRGILNGTCAYILSRMQSETISFADALAEAQRAGYAEADPSEDLDGADAAAKLAIIAAVGLRRPVRVTDIATQVDPADRAGGFRVRARARLHDPPDCARLGRGQRRRVRRGAARARAALVELRTHRRQPESRHGPRRLRRRNVVLRVGRRRIADGGRRRLRRAVGAPARRRAGAGQRRRPRSTRSAATSSRRITCASPSTTSPASSPQVTTAYARYGINIEGVLQLPKFRKDRLPFVTTLEECSESVLDRALAEVAKSDYHVQPPLSLPIFAA